ncbi:SDR family NAD(P)-dependent oxidoreductase [Bordetella hinzii]|jgi:NAD(P)-dependent dehydrogenase (short-subunit alcohol dehydrogenase family)|uniref:SDR family oxidoreductase n=2 Tax=Bordetella hinzii TaxID=103855 RepID=A0AAN1RWQ7_9BORD|nr:SDR family oxidoreductase [Bordetella hinzii]AKQ57494.1 2,3-dihydro-2,3-dihydroxybenzoate dehydrogenase [Bordetella hinzii]AKQ61960.1 2,3-dihydro-2,3-dihydroxybenzoate dehydrogenase [Bordetella hinzii]AZW17115.1 SDR family oxidoreductase [Bordetella hinzii]KCB22881.1 NAD(P)H-binding protein, PF13460 family [Bordetella hinzii OH87 BAL007II]KCB33980.1 NAD(P)H-binding protein, PF13460 family [Bordetella hinzii L60]
MNDFMNLAGKRILLLGATADIGRAIALNARDLGAEVQGIVRQDPGDMGFPVEALDLLDALAVEAYVRRLDTPLDGLVYCIGDSIKAPLSSLTPDVVHRAVDVNLNTLIVMLRALVMARKLKRGASVVLVSSVSAYLGVRGMAPYAMTKSALLVATRTFSNELMRHGVRVNSVSPVMVRTRMFEPEQQAWLEEMSKRHYPQGLGEPVDVAAPVLFLLSDEASAINGTDIILSAGAMTTA